VLFIAETPINLDDVRVVEKILDFEFTDELDEEVVANDSFLLDDFEAKYHTCPNFAGKIDTSEFALPQPADDFEAIL
jgi:hypothetical protein